MGATATFLGSVGWPFPRWFLLFIFKLPSRITKRLLLPSIVGPIVGLVEDKNRTTMDDEDKYTIFPEWDQRAGALEEQRDYRRHCAST